jgi:hypothetical protein
MPILGLRRRALTLSQPPAALNPFLPLKPSAPRSDWARLHTPAGARNCDPRRLRSLCRAAGHTPALRLPRFFRRWECQAAPLRNSVNLLNLTPSLNISHSPCSADFQVCRIAGFQTRWSFGHLDALPIWKSATRRVWEPALQARHRVSTDRLRNTGARRSFLLFRELNAKSERCRPLQNI